MAVPANIFEQLRSIQTEHGYLPADKLRELSESSKVPLYHIHGVADFYPHFHLSPPPKVSARVCMDMSCHLRGAGELRASLKSRFGGMNPRDVAIGEVSCLGQCDGAPAVCVNDRIFRHANSAQAEALVLTALGGGALPSMSNEGVAAKPACDPYRDGEKYGALRNLMVTRDFDGVIASLKASGLAGLGGAGFPTGIKWDAVRKARAAAKFVICNADESEPGTIKDRFLLQNLPHLIVEGMIIAGLVTRARNGFLYIRHEYAEQEHILAEEIERARAAGLLGSRLLDSELGFDIEIFVSPGGYICGEETALMEAIEGKRAEPRNKPPFPVTNGLWNQPTVLNNVETFANVPQVLMNGVEWFKAQAEGGAAGLKFIGISGDVLRPGVYEIPMGLPMSSAIFDVAGGIAGGKRLKAFAPSGPSSGYLPASMVDVRIDFKSLAAAGSMMGSCAIVVCAEGRCMLDMALNACAFFRNESCGKCVPCRVGTQKMVDLLTAWSQGKGTRADLALLDELAESMKLTSICGLGQFAHSPITSVLKHFREEIEAHIIQRRCPEGVCPMRAMATA